MYTLDSYGGGGVNDSFIVSDTKYTWYFIQCQHNFDNLSFSWELREISV